MSDNLLALVLERDKEIAALHKAMDERAKYNGALQDAANEAYDILEAERDRLREALKPFVYHYEPWMDEYADDEQSIIHSKHTFGDLRRARAALAKEGQ